MAHALVMALGTLDDSEGGGEMNAYQTFHKYFPGSPLLIDTYDPVVAAKLLAEEVKAGKMVCDVIRLDSGDLVALSKEIREILPKVDIMVSGDLDEREIAKLKRAGAQIQGYGLGTKLVTGNPVNGVYKLVEIDGKPTMKKSLDKMTLPGKKQVRRKYLAGKWQEDCLCLADEDDGILILVYEDGKSLLQREPVTTIRERVYNNVLTLPEEIRAIENPLKVEVNISDRLEDLTRKTLNNLG
jgi:nicotinate phosphoribosyltransferase